MTYTAHKITKGKKTYVVVVDENGVECGRCGGNRAERARFALLGRQWRSVSWVEGTAVPAVEGNQKAVMKTKFVEAGRVTLKAVSDPGKFYTSITELRTTLEAAGFARVSVVSGGAYSLEDAVVVYGNDVVDGYEVREWSPWLVGLRQNPTKIDANGRVGYETVDQILPIC